MHKNVFRNKLVEGTEKLFCLEIRFLMTDLPIKWQEQSCLIFQRNRILLKIASALKAFTAAMKYV